MNKILLAGLVAVTAAVSFAAPSQAHHRWRHHHWAPHYNVIVDPYYGDDYGYSCYWKKIVKYNKWGNVVVKKVQVCN